MLKRILALVCVLVMFCVPALAKSKTTPTPTPSAKDAAALAAAQELVNYLDENGCLPERFITKKEAQDLGWDSSYNYVSDVAPGKALGNNHYGNYQGLLPDAKGRKWQECDCAYVKGKRDAYRLIYSNDGLYYFTADHYNTFTQLFPEEETEATPTPKPSPTPTKSKKKKK